MITFSGIGVVFSEPQVGQRFAFLLILFAQDLQVVVLAISFYSP